jgi:ribonuclease D
LLSFKFHYICLEMSNNIQLHKNDLPDDLDLGNLIAVDGEFMGLNVRRDPLCLIQISSGNSDAHIIQFDRKNYNAPNLTKLLADDNTTKIFHYGRADMAHIKHYLKTDTNNILDTKIASKLARSYSDSHSLKTLIKEFIHIDISKQFQSSDFGGELSPAQLKYCANDVIYLHKIHEELNKILERENRIDLYKDCLKFLKTRVNLDLALFKDDIWSH